MPYKNSAEHKAAKARWYQKNKQLTKDRALASKRRTQERFKKMKLNDIQSGCLVGSEMCIRDRKRTAFNDYVDGLNKDGLVTDYQAYNWSNPF